MLVGRQPNGQTVVMYKLPCLDERTAQNRKSALLWQMLAKRIRKKRKKRKKIKNKTKQKKPKFIVLRRNLMT